MNRVEIRIAAMERAGGRCEFPGCTYPNVLEMAHLSASGMGGSKQRDRLDNLAMLCRPHHDWLDCRITPNMRRYENEQAVRYLLGRF